MRPNPGALFDLALELLTLFEIAALAQLWLYPNSIYASGSFSWAHDQLFQTLVPLSPILLIMLLYGWAMRLVLQVVWKGSGRVNRIAQEVANIMRQTKSADSATRDQLVLSHPLLLLVVALITSALLGALPYRADLNPMGSLVGIDTPRYIEWTYQMLASPPEQAILYAFGGASHGSRPLPLILFYLIASLGFSPDIIVGFSPALLGPLLCLSTYIFVKTGLGDRRAAALAALFACFSFDVTVGIWAGYIANWLAMVFVLLFSAGLLAFSSTHKKTTFLQLTALSVALQLTHPWTWALLLAATLVYGLTRARGELRSLTLPVVVWVATGGVVDFVKSQVGGGVTLAADVGTKGAIFGLQELFMFWPNLIQALTVTYDALLGNALLLGLGALPFVYIASRNRLKAFLACWVAVASLLFPLFNSFHQTRLIFDLPIPALAAIGLLLLLNRAGGGNLRTTLLFLVVMLFSANYAISSILRA